jgi:chromosome segregation ATPase
MKQKTIVTLVVATGLILLAASWFRSCAVDARIRKAKLAYQELRAITEAESKMMSTRLDELNKAIGHRDEAIGKLESEVAAKNLEISAAKTELAELQAAEPPTTPEIEALPIVINLRGQVAKLTDMFNLSQNTITIQSLEIDELWGKTKLLEDVVAEWKGGYEREHALRIQAENMFKICERGRRLQKFWKTTAIVATGAVTGLLLLK